MTCEDFQLRLTAFSLGELEQGEVSDARDHVATCDDCASRLLLDRQLTALLRASAVPAPQETVTAVLATVRAEAGAGRLAPSPRQPARRRHWLALAAAMLAAAAVLAVALLVVPAPDPGSPLSAAWSSYHARGEDGLGAPQSWGRTRAPPTWPPSASPRTAGRPATWPGTWPRWPSTATPTAGGSP